MSAAAIWALLGLIGANPSAQPVEPVLPEFIEMMRGRVALTCYFILATLCAFVQTLSDRAKRIRRERARSLRR